MPGTWKLRPSAATSNVAQATREAPLSLAERFVALLRYARRLGGVRDVGDGPIDEIARRVDPNARDLASGARVSERYEIGRVLGRGGMGVVYEAFDSVRGTRIALKTMRSLDAAALYRFKNEFRALSDISPPNLVTLHELESDGGETYITMEYVEGGDFLHYVSGEEPAATRIEDAPTVPRADAAPVGGGKCSAPGPAGRASDTTRLRAALRQLVEGICALHAGGKLHRDLKPSNVLVTAAGRVVVLDFGLVATLGHQAMESNDLNIVGTPEYMSPEQASGASLTEASDWYSVGVMLHQALVGALPFTGLPLKILLDKQQVEPARPSQLALGVPEDLDDLCVSLLRRNPAQRPTASRLREVLGIAPTVQRPAAPLTMPTMSATFVGRDRHTQQLARAFESTSSGRAVVAYVHGGSGMGKSLLVRRWLDTLTVEDRALVLAGRCYERESVPYKALDSIIDALSRHLRRLPARDVAVVLPRQMHALTRLFPVLGRVEAVGAARRRLDESPDPQEIRRRAATALRELFERMTMRKPLVLWIDDLQWGDSDSAMLIEELLRPPEPPALLLVASYRTEDAASPLVVALREARVGDNARDGRGADVHEIHVGALGPADARKLALMLIGREDPQAVAHASTIATESRGSPFFIDELVRHVTGGQALESQDAARTLRLDDVLYARVSALPDDARRLLEVVAVAGTPIARPVAASAAGLEGEQDVTPLALLRTGKFVRSRRSADQYDIETYHDRIRETVVARLDAASCSRLHLRVALALVARGNADPEALVVHFREGGDLHKAAEFAATAAEKAVEALAFERAASLWRSALELPGIAPDTARALHWKLGDALANAGRGTAAAEAYTAAALGAAAGDRLELRRRATEQLLRSGRIAEGMRALEEVLAAVGMRMPATTLMVLLSIVFLEVALRVRGFRFRTRDSTELSATALTKIDIAWSVGSVLAMVQPIPAKVFQKRHLLLALRAGEPRRIARGLGAEIATGSFGGPNARARNERRLRAALELSNHLADPYSKAFVSSSAGLAYYFEGRFRTALESCDRGVADFRDHCSGALWEIATASTTAFWALFQLGEMAELSRRVPVLAQEARERGDLYLLTNARIGVSNAVWLAAGDPDGAERDLTDAMSQWGSVEQQVQQYHELLARVHIELYRGRGREALALIERRWRPLARAHLLRIQLVRVMLHHLRGRAAVAAIEANEVEGAAADALAKEALRDARRIVGERAPWSTPLGKLLEAAVRVRRGERRVAIALLRAAAEELDANGMALWSAAAARRCGELVGGAEGGALIDEADTKMRAKGVKDPAKYCAMLAPGYPPPDTARK